MNAYPNTLRHVPPAKRIAGELAAMDREIARLRQPLVCESGSFFSRKVAELTAHRVDSQYGLAA